MGFFCGRILLRTRPRGSQGTGWVLYVGGTKLLRSGRRSGGGAFLFQGGARRTAVVGLGRNGGSFLFRGPRSVGRVTERLTYYLVRGG